jgi:hypothetical protein
MFRRMVAAGGVASAVPSHRHRSMEEGGYAARWRSMVAGWRPEEEEPIDRVLLEEGRKKMSKMQQRSLT